MSLRVKFLGLLVIIPSICLAIFLYFALRTFVDAKRSSLLEEQFNLLNAAGLFLAELPNGSASTVFQEKLANLTRQEGFESLLVIDSTGRVLAAGDDKKVSKSVVEILGKDVVEKLAAQQAVEGSFESLDSAGEDRFVSFMKVGSGSLSAILLLHCLKGTAMRASTLFFLKSGSVFTALVAFAVLVSLLFSSRLSNGIVHLSRAMAAFGKGDSQASLPTPSNDEVGAMTRQFQSMRLQIGELMEEQKEKAKIETELRLAGELQKRFFPKSLFQVKGVEFAGFFEPALEAGGDWWFYFQKGNELVFILGDVTGHGFNSAMITAVSRSAFSLIEDHFVSPSESLRLLNRAIYDVSKGELCMTSILGAVNLETGLLRYATASHEPPFVLPAVDGVVKLNDLVILNAVVGPRLGEASEAVFAEATYQLKSDEAILFYTDGLTDLQSPGNEALSERRLMRGLCKEHARRFSASELLEKVKSIAFTHRLNADLVDDLSFFFVKWRTPA